MSKSLIKTKDVGVVQKMEMRELELIEIGDDTDWERPRKRKRTAGRETVSKQRKRRRRRRRRLIGLFLHMTVFTAVIGMAWILFRLADSAWEEMTGQDRLQTMHDVTEAESAGWEDNKWKDFYAAELPQPELNVQLLTVNEYSRPGEALPEVENIFVHYTANVGTTAAQNRSYFESLAETHERSASAHFVIGFDGEIVQCIPTKEIAYAVMQHNYNSLSIECCYLDENGKFTEETYQSLIELTAWLLHKYRLTPEDVLRHYDAGGKNCPKYYVENEDAWQQFLADLTDYMTAVSW